jgi:hypothetical protein
MALSAACHSAPPEPGSSPESTAKVASARKATGSWYEISLPSDWVDMARRTEAEVQAVEAAWRSPPFTADRRVILARPLPFTGDARAYAETQRLGLSVLGMTKASETNGKLGAQPATVIDFHSPKGDVRWWFFTRDGMVGALQCSENGAPSTSVPALCDRIATSFRIIGKLPATPPATAPTSSEPRDLELAGFRFRVPGGWQPAAPEEIARVKAMVPTAVWVVRSQQLVGRLPAAATLTIEPFQGTVDAYVEQAGPIAQTAGLTLLARRPGRLLGARALELEYRYPAQLGGQRAVALNTVRHGKAEVLTCTGDPDAFEVARGACALIASSLTAVGMR